MYSGVGLLGPTFELENQTHSQCRLDSAWASLCDQFCSVFLWIEFLLIARWQKATILVAIELHLLFFQIILYGSVGLIRQWPLAHTGVVLS